MSRSRILIIGILVVVAILAGLLIYNIVLRRQVEEAPPEFDVVSDVGIEGEEEEIIAPEDIIDEGISEIFTPGVEAEIQLPLVSQLSNDPILSATLTSDNDRIFYVRADNGTMHALAFTGGEAEQKIFSEMSDLRNIQFNKNNTKALLSFDSDTDPDGLGHRVLDIRSQQVSDLHPNIGEVTWDDTGTKLVYVFHNTQGNFYDLSVSQSDGSLFRSVKNIDTADMTVGIIPRTNFVYYYQRSNSFVPSTLKTVALDSSEESLLSEQRYGFDVLWSPDGSRALFFETTTQGGNTAQVSVYERATGNLLPLRIITTKDKVVWAPDNISFYVALPDNLGSAYPDDYYSGLLSIQDTFWKINSDTGLVEQITRGGEVAEDINATNLFLSPDGRHLFFINQNNQKLYSINFQ